MDTTISGIWLIVVVATAAAAYVNHQEQERRIAELQERYAQAASKQPPSWADLKCRNGGKQ